MRRRIEAELALVRLQARLPAADLRVAGELAGEQEMRLVELEGDGGLVDLDQPARLALGRELRRRRLIRSLFWYMSSYQNTKSSAVNGAPSDHFMPLRRKIVVRLPSADCSQPLATPGTILVPVTSQNSSLSPERMRLPFSPSPGPRKPRRQVPPYLPTLRSGFSTIGSLRQALARPAAACPP